MSEFAYIDWLRRLTPADPRVLIGPGDDTAALRLTPGAEELLAAPNVGVVTWASLARYDGPPEVLLQRCRDRIEREGGTQRANLLAVALTALIANTAGWLASFRILGRKPLEALREE